MSKPARCQKTLTEISIGGEHEHTCVRTPGHALIIDGSRKLDHICACGAVFTLDIPGVAPVASLDAQRKRADVRPAGWSDLEEVLQEQLDWTWHGEPGVPSGESLIHEIAEAIRAKFDLTPKEKP